jgi:putative phage abortive infection protein
MKIWFITLKPDLTIDTIILTVTAIILYRTARIMKRGNDENAILNRVQAAENTIFKQIDFHNNLLNAIIVPSRGGYIHGQDAFKFMYDELKEIYHRMPGNAYKDPFDIDAEDNRIKDSFYQLYQEFGNSFGNYFKNLYLLVKYIDDKSNDTSLKGFQADYYINLIKSQLSKYEILLLAYDCIWIQDKPKGEKFIELAKRNDLLSALEPEELFQSVSNVTHIELFRVRYGIDFEHPRAFTN